MTSLTVSHSISLKPLVRDDALELLDVLVSESERLCLWLPEVADMLTIEGVSEHIARAERSREIEFGFRYTIREHDKIIGECGVVDYVAAHGTAEFGYWICQSHVGRGIVTASVRSLMRMMFSDYNVQRAEIFTSTENMAARAVAERLGFTLEGVKRQCERVGDRILDHAIYGLLKDEWEATDQ
jgi:ribosomal-protein-serine acetyltransferase